METNQDSYSATQASKVLGVSPRRIRQLVEEKRLKVTQKKPLRVSAVGVLAMRDKRKAEGLTPKPKTSSDSELLKQSLETLSSAVELMQRQITTGEDIARRNEDNLREALAEQRQRADKLEQELTELRNKKRGFFR
jgi:hypothetical protein